MNFAQMLQGISNSLTGERATKKKRSAVRTKLRQGEKTPEMLAKRKATMRAARNAKWRAAFAKHNGTATSEQLANTMNRTIGSVNSQLIDMRNEIPPVVAVIAKMECGSNNRKYLYRWVLD